MKYNISMEPSYSPLLKYLRNGLAEQVHFGIVLHMNKDGVIKKIGDDNGYKFYHRSCMKPLQASLMIDLGVDTEFDLTSEEIAVCCASHVGDTMHRDCVFSILNKIGCRKEDLLCSSHLPISNEEKKNLLLSRRMPDRVHHNCSGKHALMLAICKKMGYPIANYCDIKHPLSTSVLKQVCKLCKCTKSNIRVAKDGCTLPVAATSLQSLGLGYLNLFTDKKYQKITDAFLNHPYLIGGAKRLDSEIINASNNLIAKVGACGLCVVVNVDKEECLIVKIADSDITARSIVTIDALLQIKWLDTDSVASNQIKQIYMKEILTQDKEVIGTIEPCFDISH